MEMDDIEQRVTEMMELDEENEADSRLEDDDQVMELINVVKDDMLMVVEMEDDGRVSQEDSNTAVMWGPTDCAHTIAWSKSRENEEDEMDTPDPEDTVYFGLN